MIISSSSVGLAQSRSYSAYQESSKNGLVTFASATSMSGAAVSLSISAGSRELLRNLKNAQDARQEQQKQQEQQMQARWKESRIVSLEEGRTTSAENPVQLKLRLLEEFMRSLNKGKEIRRLDWKNHPDGQPTRTLRQIMPASGTQISLGSTFTRQTVTSSFTGEAEQTAFCGIGSVTTADGRQVNFNLQMEMSRSFMQQTRLVEEEKINLRDPLVINFSGDPTALTDQKFFFDIDADGKKDSISFVSSGSGFLALDKNGDGIINDGSELFGTGSGDGFKDLARYDQDGNGWIDEADEIFRQLKIWTKDEDGNDVLMDLKKAGVGAIYLDSVDTRFSLNQAQSNKTNGILQKTGIYLKENGQAGTVHHIDLAVG